MNYKIERMLKRYSLIVCMFFLFSVISLFKAQSVQAWVFHPFCVTITAEEKCKSFDLKQKVYITEVMDPNALSWEAEEVPSLITIEPASLQKGELNICIANINCSKISIYVSDSKKSTSTTVKLKLTIISTLNIRGNGEEWPPTYSDISEECRPKYPPDIQEFPEEFQPYEGTSNPFLRPRGSERNLDLWQYVYDTDNNKITWEVSGDEKTWITDYTDPKLHITINNILGVATIKGKESVEQRAVKFRATNSCGFSDEATLSITVNEAPVITDNKFRDTIEPPYELNLNECVSDDMDIPDEIKWRINNVEFDENHPYEDDYVKVIMENRIAKFSSKNTDWSEHTLYFTAIDNAGIDNVGASSPRKPVLLKQESVPVVKYPPVIDMPAIWNELLNKFGKKEVVISVDKPYELILDNKVTDVDTPIEKIKWTLKEQNDYVDVIISDDNHSATFKVKSVGLRGTQVILTASDDDGLKDDTEPIPVSLELPPPPPPEWILLQPGKPQCFPLNPAVSRNFSASDHVEAKQTNNLLCIQIKPNQSILSADVEYIHETVTNSNSAVLILPDSLEFEEDREFLFRLPQYVNGKKVTWTPQPNSYLNITDLAGVGKLIKSKEPNWHDKTTMVLTADCSGKQESAIIDVEITPVCDPPVIDEKAILSDLKNAFQKEEVVISVNKPYNLRLDNKVTDVDTPIELIKWAAQDGAHIAVTVSPDNRSATFNVNVADWCGVEAVTLIASDDCQPNAKTDKIIIPVRVIGSPVITLPECILLQPRMYRSLDLTKYVSACDTTVSWKFSDSASVEAKITNNLLTLQIKPNQSILSAGVESIGYTATNADNLAISGNIAVLILPDRLPDFEEDREGALDLPQDVNGKQVTWTPVPNTVLDIEIKDSKVIVKAKPDWFGKTKMSLTAACSGKQETADIDVTVTPVNDQPVIEATSFPNDIIIQPNKPYILRLDKVRDVDIPKQKIEWKLDKQSNYVDVIISPDHRSVTFKVKAGDWCGTEYITLIASDDGKLPGGATSQPLSDSIDLPVLVTGHPVITLPEWILWQSASKSKPLDLRGYIKNCSDGVSWQFVDSTHIKLPKDPITDWLTFTVEPSNWLGVENIRYTTTNGNNKSTSGVLAVIAVPDQLSIQKNGEYLLDLPIWVGGKKISWSLKDSGNKDIPPIAEGKFVIKPNALGWGGGTQVLLLTADPNGRNETVVIDVTITTVCDAPVINDTDIFNELINVFGKPEVVISVNKSYDLRLDNKVTDVDTPLTLIKWNSQGSAHVDVIITGNQLATFKVKNVGWCGVDAVTLTASDNCQPNAKTDDIIIPVRVIGSPVITLDEWILLQPRTSRCLDLTQYVTACDTTVSWNFLDSARVEHKKTNNLLCLQIKPNLPILPAGVESVGYTATNADNLSISGNIAVLILPDRLEFKEDEEGVFDLPQYVNGKQVTWAPVSNDVLDITILPGKAIVKSKTKDWYGKTTISFDANCSGKKETANIDVTVISVNDPPAMSPWMLQQDELYLQSTVPPGQTVKEWKFFRGNHINLDPNPPPPAVPITLRFTTVPANWWGAENIYYTVTYDNGVSISGVLPVISIGDLESKEDVPITVPIFRSIGDVPLTWVVSDGQHVKVTLDAVKGTITFTPEPNWNGSEGIPITLIDGNGKSVQRTINVNFTPVDDPLIMPLWMPQQEELYLPSTVPPGQTVKKWEFFKGNHITPVPDPPPPADVPVTLRFTTAPNNWWGAENIYYTVTYDNVSTSGALPVISIGDLVSDEDVPIIVPLISSIGGVSLTWNVLGSPHIIVTLDPVKGTITFAPELNWSGNENISVTLIDSNGKSVQRTINVKFNSVDDPIVVKKDQFPNPVRFNTSDSFQIPLSALVDNPDNIPITWSSTIAAPVGNAHISVDFQPTPVDAAAVTFSVAPGHKGWSGKEPVILTVNTVDPNKQNLLKNKTIPLTVEVYGGRPVIDMPNFKPWNSNSDWWDLSQYITNSSDKNSIIWTFTPTQNVTSKVVGNYVKFIFLSQNWVGEEEVSYTAYNNNTGITINSSITIIGVPGNVTGGTINMPSSFKWNNQSYNLTWTYQQGLGVIPTPGANNQFTFRLAPNITTGEATLMATGGGYSSTVFITVNAGPPVTVIIKPSRFSMEKGFFVENEDVSLKIEEDSKAEVNLADKAGSSGESTIAPALVASKIIWTAQRSQHINVQIDNVKQTATFIPDADWNNSITGEPELVQLTAADEKTGNSDTIEIKVTVVPTPKPGIETINIPVVVAKTALLNNFPNPFNAETWIPYKLSADSDVKISIYNQRGQLVRTIDLGHRKMGIYVTKDKAAYWDGEDEAGENVASGVYFYTLQAGRFSATRKMVIMK